MGIVIQISLWIFAVIATIMNDDDFKKNDIIRMLIPFGYLYYVPIGIQTFFKNFKEME